MVESFARFTDFPRKGLIRLRTYAEALIALDTSSKNMKTTASDKKN